MATLQLGNKTLFTQSGSNDPVMSSDVTMPSGTMVNIVAQETVITATQILNTSAGLICTGSSYSYTPAANSTKVWYQYQLHIANVSTNSVANFQVELETGVGTGIYNLVPGSNHGVYHPHGDQNAQIGMYTIMQVLDSWSGAKTIQVRGAGLNSSPTSYQVKLHETDYAVGDENAQPGANFGVSYVYPKLLIYSIM